ncbi:hypothetical protein CJ030_MR4G022375 [Morella rubra]|uniref:Myb/SANT-like domain-containing protein n=1 Tax=Morella rubra TaxID=262757 RepID=A0A6A1VRF4_9ROSI|nr:hypothetical protein CJ030_MR4G022375 [Morella rubra]
MPTTFKPASKRSVGSHSSRNCVSSLPSATIGLPRTPDSRDSQGGHRRLISPPTTTTTAPTTRSKSKPYNLRPRSWIPLNNRNIRKPPRRRKLMGKGSDWTASQKLHLLNILKDKAGDGSVQNASPHAGMWPVITSQFNTATGLSKTTAQVQEKLRRMKKQWKRFRHLLHHETGFGWDAPTNTVSGTVAQWESYLSVHKNAASFRKKGLANYELMTELFVSSTATGRLKHASPSSPPDTDDECEFERELHELGMEDLHDPPTPPASATRPPSPTRTNSRKRASDSTSSIHQHSKRSRGKSQADKNSTALLKFVGAQDRRNEILEQWIAIQNKVAGITTSNQVGPDCANDTYSKCLIMMQSILGEDEHAVLLKGCKELESEYAQKAFLVMTEAQRKTWLYAL